MTIYALAGYSPCATGSKRTAAHDLIYWAVGFEVPLQPDYDSSGQFRNDRGFFNESFLFTHNLTLFYCPSSNAILARSGNQILRYSLVLLSELQQRPQEWHQGQKVYLCFRGLRRLTKSLNNYVFRDKDLRNQMSEIVDGRRLSFQAEDSLNADAFMTSVLYSEISISVSQLLQRVKQDHHIFVSVHFTRPG